jgi:hypothetical protein
MREHRAWTAREDSRHVEALSLEELAWDEGIDALVNAVESAGRDTISYGGCGQAQRAQLVEAKHAMLPKRQLCQGRLEKRPSRGRFSCRLRHPRQVHEKV